MGTMWRVVGLVLVLACSPPKPAPSPPVPPAPLAPTLQVVEKPLVPRPEIAAVPSMIDEMEESIAKDRRWPLTRAYAIEPHFDLGYRRRINWTAFCNSRPRISTELDHYFATWCRIRALDDVEAAVRGLAKLLAEERSTEMAKLARQVNSHMLARAVREDIATLLADREDGSSALRWLQRQKIESIEMLDLLATAYVETDRHSDARQIIDRVDALEPNPAADVACRRLRRQFRVSSTVARRIDLRARIVARARESKHHVCERLAIQLACPLATGDAFTTVEEATTACIGVFDRIQLGEAKTSFAAAYRAWPQGRATFQVWWDIAVGANRARPLEGADELMVAALHNAVLESGCEPTLLGQIRLLASAVRSTSDHPPKLDAQLDRLADIDPRICAQ